MDNAFAQDVPQPNPVGHRLTIDEPVSTPDKNPLDYVEMMLQTIKDKGYTVTQIKASSRLMRQFRQHPLVRSQIGGSNRVTTTDGSFTLDSQSRSVTNEQINAFFEENGYGSNLFSTYDETYDTLYGPRRFLRENAMLFVAVAPITDAQIRAVRGESTGRPSDRLRLLRYRHP